MSAPSPTGPLPSGSEDAACGPGTRSRWVWLPLVLAITGIVVLGGVAWWWGGVASSPWSGLPHPFFWPLVPLAFFVVLVLVFSFARFPFWGWRGRGAWSHGPDAREILRIRFARGEISRDQLRQMLRDLNESP